MPTLLKLSWTFAEDQCISARRTLQEAEEDARLCAAKYLKSICPEGTIFVSHNFSGERQWQMHYEDENKLIKWICYPLKKDGTRNHSINPVMIPVTIIEKVVGLGE